LTAQRWSDARAFGDRVCGFVHHAEVHASEVLPEHSEHDELSAGEDCDGHGKERETRNGIAAHERASNHPNQHPDTEQYRRQSETSGGTQRRGAVAGRGVKHEAQ